MNLSQERAKRKSAILTKQEAFPESQRNILAASRQSSLSKREPELPPVPFLLSKKKKKKGIIMQRKKQDTKPFLFPCASILASQKSPGSVTSVDSNSQRGNLYINKMRGQDDPELPQFFFSSSHTWTALCENTLKILLSYPVQSHKPSAIVSLILQAKKLRQEV